MTAVGAAELGGISKVESRDFAASAFWLSVFGGIFADRGEVSTTVQFGMRTLPFSNAIQTFAGAA